MDLCITEESRGNKGALKIIFSGLQRSIVYFGNLSENRIDELFLYINPKTKTSLLEKIFDISIKKPELTNRFMDLFEDLFTSSKLKAGAKKIIQKYFEENTRNLISKIYYYKKNNFSQEFYQILLYIVQFNINTRGILSKKNLLSLIDERVDDFSLCLLTIIYIKRKLDIKDLLDKINNLLEETYRNYTNQSRFSGKFWYYRYFIYYLIKNNIINGAIVKSYLRSKGFQSGRYGYKSELNANYIFTQGNQQNINNFYKDLLDLNVTLVDCGKNQDFIYF